MEPTASAAEAAARSLVPSGVEYALVLDGVWVLFSDGQETAAQTSRAVLRDITLRVRRGEWLSVVGPNGSGKSILARVIGGLSPVSRGAAKRSGRTALVFQNPDAQVVGDTVREDICFGLEAQSVSGHETTRRLNAALSATGLQDAADDAAWRLSGGQKQLLASAAAMALLPDTIIFDEATSMLDPLSRDRVLAIAQDLRQQGATIVWVTQWLEELAQADRVIALTDGQIVYDGAPQAFFYGNPPGVGASPCDRLGFTPPFVVRTARELAARRGPLPIWPQTPEELARCVEAL